MAHECDDCGESFETLSRLRLHDCVVSNDQSEASLDSQRSASGASSPTGERNAFAAELEARLDRFSDGDVDALHDAVATFESALSGALEEDTSGGSYRDVFWPYHERVSDALDEATQSAGWEFLGAVVDTHGPMSDSEIPLVTPTIANAVGRYLIRARVNDGVEAVPVEALEYLDAVAVNADDSDDIAREEVHAYGWGIGHPQHSVVDRLRARASADVFSVTASLEHAFYADQYAAIDALEALVRDESLDGMLSRVGRDDMPYRRYLLDCVYGLNREEWPRTPRYYDWQDDLDYTFELDDTVEERIRTLVEESGFDAGLSDDWTLRDLGV